MRPILRPYQVASIEQLRAAIRRGYRRIVLIMPTGGGKTVVAAEMIRAAMAKEMRALFLAHRKELIDQTVEKLASFDVRAGVIMAGDRRRDDWLPVQVASVQTLRRRLDRKPVAKLIIIDECHHSLSDTYKAIIEAYPDAIVIGLTATPWRSDKMGLSDIYETSVLACTPSELMRMGSLVQYDAFAYDAPDLHSVKIVAGEYNQKDLAVACNTKVLVGNMIREYATHAAGKRAIVFPVNIDGSQTIVAEALAAGFSAAHVDCYTPRQLREQTMNRFRNGDLLILSSCGVLTEGFDAPSAEVCILGRPTKSLTLHLQMIGRVLRPSPNTGKQRALIHDHAGNIMRHGFPDDERNYDLLATPDTVIAAKTCPACLMIFNQTKKGRCPNCNELIAIPEERAESGGRSDQIEVDGRRISKEEIQQLRNKRSTEGITRQLSDIDLARAATATVQEKAAEYLRLKQVAERKGFQPGFAGHQFRAVFTHWPQFHKKHLQDVEPATKPFLPLETMKKERG